MKVMVVNWWDTREQHEVEIDDLEWWLRNHGGAVMIRPPNLHPEKKWVIAVTDSTNRFNQR